jgi:hypothetical protein
MRWWIINIIVYTVLVTLAYGPRPFNRERWLANQDRNRMVTDLRWRYLRVGTPQEEVERLLGEGGFGSGLYYELDKDVIAIDYTQLVIIFDERGRLKSSFVMSH